MLPARVACLLWKGKKGRKLIYCSVPNSKGICYFSHFPPTEQHLMLDIKGHSFLILMLLNTVGFIGYTASVVLNRKPEHSFSILWSDILNIPIAGKSVHITFTVFSFCWATSLSVTTYCVALTRFEVLWSVGQLRTRRALAVLQTHKYTQTRHVSSPVRLLTWLNYLLSLWAILGEARLVSHCWHWLTV